MNAYKKAAFIAAIAALSLCAASVIGTSIQTAHNSEQVSALEATAADASTSLASAQKNLASKQDDLAGVATEHETRKAVLSQRPAFVAAVANADAALRSANGKVEVGAQRKKVIAAQNAVLAEKADAAVVTAQTKAVAGVAGQVSAEVKSYDQRVAAEAAARAAQSATRSAAKGHRSSSARTSQTTRPSNQSNSSSGNWFADIRQRLNAVGGGHIKLTQYSGSCSGRFAVACSARGGNIFVHPDIAKMSSSRKNWAMVHELAHQYHFLKWDAVNSSSGYRQLFRSNPEVLANCMASARGYSNHGHRCSKDMVSWASGVWSGRIGR